MEFPAVTRFQNLNSVRHYSEMERVPVREGITSLLEAQRRTGINHSFTLGQKPCIELSVDSNSYLDLTGAQINVQNLRSFLLAYGPEEAPDGFQLREEPASDFWCEGLPKGQDLTLAIILARLGPLVETAQRETPVTVPHFRLPDVGELLGPLYLEYSANYLHAVPVSPKAKGALAAYISDRGKQSHIPLRIQEQDQFITTIAQALYVPDTQGSYDFLTAARKAASFGYRSYSWEMKAAIERCYGLNIIPGAAL